MTEITLYKNVSDLGPIAPAWDRLSQREQRFFPNASEAQSLLASVGGQFRIVVAKNGSEETGIACFLFDKAELHFTLGERRLFSLPIREISVLGSSVLGEAEPEIIKSFFKIVLNEWDYDLVRVGEVIIGSPIHQAMSQLDKTLIGSKYGRRESKRWMIQLPESFDSYLTSLRSTTRKSIKQYIRTFEKNSFEFHVICRPDQIDRFLRDGEQISRSTYQWTVGQRLCNDDATRQRYMRLASAGNLRCYIIYIGGCPCAFARGELNHDFYSYETPGFDPQFGKLSPGLVLLAWVIRDLIENTDCKVFDFGVGGDERDYKSRFGTSFIPSTTMLLARRYKPYSLFAFLLHEAFAVCRLLAKGILGDGLLVQRLKKSIRRYGAQ
jgi:hypothetical protein